MCTIPKKKTNPKEINLQLDNHTISNISETKFLGNDT